MTEVKEKQEPVELSEKEILSKHLDNITAMLKYSNATTIGSLSDDGYGCLFCKEVFGKPNELKEHTSTTHLEDVGRIMEGKTLSDYLVKLDITGLQCEICKIKLLHSMPSLEDLVLHLGDHKKTIHKDIKNQIMPFYFLDDALKCVVCQQEFVDFETLTEHMHQHYRNYICENCPAGFINEKSYQDHKVLHVKGEFKCKDCDQMFDTLHKKKLHEAVYVHVETRIKCDFCRKSFLSERNKQRHVAALHTDKLREIAAKIARQCLSKRKR